MIHNLQALLKINTYESATKTFILPLNICICYLLFLIVWLIDRFTYYVNQRINQLIYGWINNSMSCSKKQFKHYFQNQRIGILLLGYHMFKYSFIHSIICSCFWLMNEWLKDWIDAYCASYFYYQSNKKQCK